MATFSLVELNRWFRRPAVFCGLRFPRAATSNGLRVGR
jgi:hypothetical protein